MCAVDKNTPQKRKPFAIKHFQRSPPQPQIHSSPINLQLPQLAQNIRRSQLGPPNNPQSGPIRDFPQTFPNTSTLFLPHSAAKKRDIAAAAAKN